METLLQPVDEVAGLFVTPENAGFPFQTVYKPLSSNRKEIRLVEIVPGSQHDKISLNLIHGCFLTDVAHTVYEALSYCVGDVTKRQKIILDGHEFEIFESLYHALSQLRLEARTSSRIVWIDQLCIQQHDLQEKKQQIGLMKNIYEESSCVLSWLGPPSIVLDSCLAFDFIEEFWQLYGDTITSTAKALVPDCSSLKEAFIKFLRGFKNDGAVSGLLDIPIETADVMELMSRCGHLDALRNLPTLGAKIDALCELLRRPYWTRKWVLQEVSAAQDGLLLCGESSTNTLRFFVTYALLAFRADLSIKSGEFYNDNVDESVAKMLRVQWSGRTHDFLNFWLFAQNSKHYSLLHALYLTRNLNATDPRDKVYALLSTADAEEVGRLGILPDYSSTTSVSTLITTICKQYVSSGKPSMGYSLAQANGILSRHEIPSWCFDFTMNSSEQPGRGSTPPLILKQGFRNVDLLQDQGNLLLIIEGVFLGVIQETSSVTYPDVTAYDAPQSELAQETYLLNEVPRFLDWMEDSNELSKLSSIDLSEALFELLEVLMDSIGQPEDLGYGVDDPSSADESSFDLTYLALLLLSLFSQFEGQYYRWQLACLRLDKSVHRCIEQESFSPPYSSETAVAREFESEDSDVTRDFSSVQKLHRILDAGALEEFNKQTQHEVQSSREHPIQSSTEECNTQASETLEQLDARESVSSSKRVDGNIPACALGVVQVPAQAGDYVFVEASGLTTFVLRSQSRMLNKSDVYKLVGTCEFQRGLTDENSLKHALRTGEVVKVAIA